MTENASPPSLDKTELDKTEREKAAPDRAGPETTTPDKAADSPVGAELKRRRRAAGLTGQQLGRRVGMSQAKISRIETGTVAADPKDVRALATALDIPTDQERWLVDQAERAHSRMTDWRPTDLGIADRQREVENVEETTTQFRVFQPTVVVGLLQTSEYARAILKRFQQGLMASGNGEPAEDVSDAVAARLQRQRVLDDKRRHFRLLMTEEVLSNQVCRPTEMLAQIERLREVGQQKNVTLGIIPADTQWEIPPYHGFELLDDKYVMVDLYNTTMTSRVKADAHLYRRVFDNLEERSTDDADKLLTKYYRVYFDLSRPADPPPAAAPA